MFWWIVDYDIPIPDVEATEEEATRIRTRRMQFYRGLWQILKESKVEQSKRSTQSVWVSDSQEIAQRIHKHAKQFGQSHLYRAEEVD